MNKYVLSAFLAVGMSVSAFAVQTVPLDTKGNPALPKYAGISTCMIDSSTGTTPLLCTTGSGIILDVIASSVATTDSIIIRDSATVNTTSALLMVIDKNSLDKAERVFPRFNNGLDVVAGVAPGGHVGATQWPSWTIIYSKDLK